jgi:hypothetical protein
VFRKSLVQNKKIVSSFEMTWRNGSLVFETVWRNGSLAFETIWRRRFYPFLQIFLNEDTTFLL